MAKVKKIKAREMLDSRGIPTISAYLELDTGGTITVDTPSGDTTGIFEPKEIRDNDQKRYDGKGVLKAVNIVNTLVAPKLIGIDVTRQHDLDYWLLDADQTDDRSRLGTNTISTLSTLFMKAGALSEHLDDYQYINAYFNKLYKSSIKLERIPVPAVNIINGGIHGSSTLDFQEFLIISQSSTPFKDALETASRIYSGVKKVLEYRNVGRFVSEQGGFSPNLRTNLDALEILKEAITKEKLRLGIDIFLGIDCASFYYYKNNKYLIKDKTEGLPESLYIDFLCEITTNYSLIMLEDPLYENNIEGWKTFMKRVSKTSYVTGDHLFAGNKKKIAKCMAGGECNGAVLKFNQYATLSELFEVISILKSTQSKINISHRLGETNDTLIADLAVGIQADFVKFGSINRGERVAKYNRLLQIEEDL